MCIDLLDLQLSGLIRLWAMIRVMLSTGGLVKLWMSSALPWEGVPMLLSYLPCLPTLAASLGIPALGSWQVGSATAPLHACMWTNSNSTGRQYMQTRHQATHWCHMHAGHCLASRTQATRPRTHRCVWLQSWTFLNPLASGVIYLYLGSVPIERLPLWAEVSRSGADIVFLVVMVSALDQVRPGHAGQGDSFLGATTWCLGQNWGRIAGAHALRVVCCVHMAV